MTLQRRPLLSLGLGALASGWANGQTAPTSPLVWRQRAMLGFGTSLWLNVAHTDASALEQALSDSVRAIRRIHAQMNVFDPDSALSRLNRHGVLHHAPEDLRVVLRLAEQVARATQGALDVSIQPLWQLWAQHHAAGERPSARAVAQVVQRVNWRAIELQGDTVRLNQAGMAISLNGLAQGHAADVVRHILQRHGVRHALVDTGETWPLGHNPQALPWQLAIEALPETPAHRLHSDDRAIATSSDQHTFFSADHRDHHIFNPHTGYSPPHWSSVSVLAVSALLADALTKVFFMTPPAQVQPVAARWGVDVIAQDRGGRWHHTDGVKPTRAAAHRPAARPVNR